MTRISTKILIFALLCGTMFFIYSTFLDMKKIRVKTKIGKVSRIISGTGKENKILEQKTTAQLNTVNQTTPNPNIANWKKCFREGWNVPNNTLKLPDVLEADRKPRPGKTIFFQETSCPEIAHLQLSPRSICSIESAAKNNPDFDIFVLFASPRYFTIDSFPDEILRLKLTYKNIFLRNNDIWEYAKNSPVENFMNTDKLFESHYFPVHLSDFLRLLNIWKFGGIYMDTDIIVKKTFQDLPLNYAGIEEHFGDMNNGVISLEPNGTGHEIGKLFLEDFVEHFEPKEWATNGPQLISRVMRKVCHSNDLTHVTVEQCQGFKVLPRETFWAVSYWNVNDFFNLNHLKNVTETTKNAYFIHLYNHITKDIKHKKGTKTLFGITAEQNCPVTYRNAADGYL